MPSGRQRSRRSSEEMKRESERKLLTAIVRARTEVHKHAAYDTRSRGRAAQLDEEDLEQVERDLTATARTANQGEEEPSEEEWVWTPLLPIEEEGRSELLQHFDLENEGAMEQTDCRPRDVAKMVLDEMAESLEEIDWWKLCRGPVWKALVEAEAETAGESQERRSLSPNEQLWKGLTEYQTHNAWSDCQKAAKLAGWLLLLDWQETRSYENVLGPGRKDAWAFPDRFLGSIYVKESECRNFLGRKLAKLYRKHREVVAGAIDYARRCRNLALEYGLGPHKRGLDGSCDAPETRADRLVLSFFPWLDAQYLGLGDNINLYQAFQKDVALFADAYDAMWNHRPAHINLSTSRLEWIPMSDCTWDCVTETLCKFPNRTKLKDHVDKQKGLRLKMVAQQEEDRKAAAKEKAEAEATEAAAAAAAVGGGDATAEVGDRGETGGVPDECSEVLGAANDLDDASMAASEGDSSGEGSKGGRLALEPMEVDLAEGGNSDSDDDDDDVMPELVGRSDDLSEDEEEDDSDDDVPELVGRNVPESDDDDSDGSSSEGEQEDVPELLGRRTTRAQVAAKEETVASGTIAGRRSAARGPARLTGNARSPPSWARRVVAPRSGAGGASAAKASAAPKRPPQANRRAAGIPRKRKVSSSPKAQSKAARAKKRTAAGAKSATVSAKRAAVSAADGSSAVAAAPREKDKIPDGTAREGELLEAASSSKPSKPSLSAPEVHGDDSSQEEEEILELEIDYAVRIVAEVPEDDATYLTVIIPKDGERIENLKSYSSAEELLTLSEGGGKAKVAATFCKRKSGLVYSVCQLTTSPHLTHGQRTGWAVQTAAARSGVTSLNLTGDVSVINSDVAYVSPGTPEYEELGLDKTVAAAVAPEVLSDLLKGVKQVVEKGKLNDQKAREFGGGSRNCVNFGVGFAGHGFKDGVSGPAEELADLSEMNVDLVRDHFPNEGECLGVILEALGEAQEALLGRLDRVERPDSERNTRYAGKVGERLGKPGCKAGESLFLSIECSKSDTMRPVLEKLNSKLKTQVEGSSVALHVDPQNPCPGSGYERVVLATWTVCFEREGEQCPIQITAILCNRAAICNRNLGMAAVDVIHENYLKGVRKFAEAHGDLRYEDDGLGLFEATKRLVLAELPDQMSMSGAGLGTWLAYQEAEGADGAADEDEAGAEPSYLLLQGATQRWSADTIGNQALRRNLWAKATSDVEELRRRSGEFTMAEMEAITANPNKMAMYSSERHAAKLVCDRFELNEQHAWDLFYCKLQHNISSATYIAMCVSLVEQWETRWKESERGRRWMAAVESGAPGSLASAFMRLSDDHSAACRMTSVMKRVHQNHYPKGSRERYTEEYCREQVELLQEFGQDVRDSSDNRPTVDILAEASHPTKGTLGRMFGIGTFVIPQIITGLFLWGLQEGIPCWRAAECPIMDSKKGHYPKSQQVNEEVAAAVAEMDSSEPEEEGAKKPKFREKQTLEKVRSLKTVHRCCLIVAHREGVAGLTVENGGCEGVRLEDVLDFLLRGMDSFDLRPTANSHPYRPCYQLWRKGYGADAAWRPVALEELVASVRVFSH